MSLGVDGVLVPRKWRRNQAAKHAIAVLLYQVYSLSSCMNRHFGSDAHVEFVRSATTTTSGVFAIGPMERTRLTQHFSFAHRILILCAGVATRDKRVIPELFQDRSLCTWINQCGPCCMVLRRNEMAKSRIYKCRFSYVDGECFCRRWVVTCYCSRDQKALLHWLGRGWETYNFTTEKPYKR